MEVKASYANDEVDYMKSVLPIFPYSNEESLENVIESFASSISLNLIL